MSSSTALLLTRNASLVGLVHQLGADDRNLHVELCLGEDDVDICLAQRGVVVAFLHLTPASEATVMRLLAVLNSGPRPTPAVVFGDPACAALEPAVRQAGAVDYLPMPLDRDRLARVVDCLLAPLPAVSPPRRDERYAAVANPQVRGSSCPEMDELMTQVRRVAPQDTTLLFTGETGTGKTRLARLIHDLSPRRDQPFLVMDCGALSPSLIESEMFGHVRGAFTGADRDRPGKLAAAGSGTLLLDEINSLPGPLQSKLLRAVDERVFEPVGSNKSQPLRARLIAVSNTPLDKEVAASRFRGDLYFRLNVVGFYLPPLRERRSMIGPLAQEFLAEFAARNRPDVLGLTEAALQRLEAYSWPGNIRELRNVIERAIALCPGTTVQVSDLPETIRATAIPPPPDAGFTHLSFAPASTQPTTLAPASTQPATLAQSREETELRRIQEALTKHRNNRKRAALELGISRMALYKKLHKYGLMNPT